jgi:OmpA-OmpF porin, OOP family
MKSIQMKRHRLALVCATSILALAACSSAKVVDEAAMAKPTGSAFNQNLHKDYVALAKSELDQGDRSDAAHYAMKAKEAAAGKPVAPDEVSARSLNAPEDKTLTAARVRLVSALDSSEAVKKPEQAAKAQSMFDCWLEQQEEGWQQADIDACRKGFDTALAALAPEKMASKPMAPQTVQFKFNSTELVPKSQGELADLIREVKLSKPKTIKIISYTDLSGDKAYNAKLAAMRGKSLETKLMDAGAQVIKVDARGPVDPVVDTEKPNQENRRAVIILEK